MITTKYLGPSNTQGSRIAVDSSRGRRVYAYDHSASDAHDAAVLRYIADNALPSGEWFCGVLRYGSRVYMHHTAGSIIAPGLDTAYVNGEAVPYRDGSVYLDGKWRKVVNGSVASGEKAKVTREE